MPSSTRWPLPHALASDKGCTKVFSSDRMTFQNIPYCFHVIVLLIEVLTSNY